MAGTAWHPKHRNGVAKANRKAHTENLRHWREMRCVDNHMGADGWVNGLRIYHDSE